MHHVARIQVSPIIEKRRRTEFSKPLPADVLPADVSLRAIRGYAHRVAQRFRPEMIILFGSHAYGEPNADSDVDLLVVMPARNQLDQAAKIRLAVPAPFAMDLIVRTPKRMRERLGWGDSFVTEIASKGKVLYEEIHGAAAKRRRSMTGSVFIANSAPRSTSKGCLKKSGFRYRKRTISKSS